MTPPLRGGTRRPAAARGAPRCGRRGFTLFEVAIVLTVVALVSAVAIPRYSNAVHRFRADAAARRIAADLERTRTRARAGSSERSIEFRPSMLAYFIEGERSLDRRSADSLVRLSDEPYRAQALSADLGGDLVLRFTGFGVPDSSGEIVVAVGSAKRRVRIDGGSGAVTVER
jgi:prepilin-type N-terminal cleavage/methylation domain-containing protein